MKFRLALIAQAFVATAMLAAPPAHAQVIDMSTLKCEDFLKSSKETMAYTVIWLDGFHTEEDDSLTMDLGDLASEVAKFSDYCRKNPTKTMTETADEILDK